MPAWLTDALLAYGVAATLFTIVAMRVGYAMARRHKPLRRMVARAEARLRRAHSEALTDNRIYNRRAKGGAS